VVITSRERDRVVAALLALRYNYGVPRIVVQDMANHALALEHLNRASTYLDRQYATQTLTYMTELWKQSVCLLTSDERGRDTTITVRPSEGIGQGSRFQPHSDLVPCCFGLRHERVFSVGFDECWQGIDLGAIVLTRLRVHGIPAKVIMIGPHLTSHPLLLLLQLLPRAGAHPPP
jgi:hypothetical protein